MRRFSIRLSLATCALLGAATAASATGAATASAETSNAPVGPSPQVSRTTNTASQLPPPPEKSGVHGSSHNPQGARTPVQHRGGPRAFVSSAGAAMTPSEAYDRALSWVWNNVPYDQGAYVGAVDNPTGPYRTDCSGFVSMAWGLNESLTTWTLPEVSTPIAPSQLQLGDTLIYNSTLDPVNGSHAVMFVQWANPQHTRYVEDEEAGDLGTVERTVPFPYDAPMDGSGSWTPYRYLNMSSSFQEFVPDHAAGRVWNEYNESAAASGPSTYGRPAIALLGASSFHVYVEQGNGDLEEYVNDGLFGRLWNAYDTTAASGGPPIRGGTTVTMLGGLVQIWVPQANGDLEEFTNDSLGGRVWNAYDLGVASGGPGTWGTPAVAVTGAAVHVYVPASNGDLEEFVNAGTPGATWKANDITKESGGPSTFGSPTVTTLSGLIQVWVRESNGHLGEYTNDAVGGRTWNSYDLTIGSGGPGIWGQPASVTLGSIVHVYAQQPNGDLEEFVSDGLAGRVWNAYDTTLASGGPPAGGSPTYTLLGGIIQIWSRQANGDLQEYTADHVAGRVWSSYDLSVASGGTQAFFDPAAIVWGGSVPIFVGGP